MNTQNLVWVYLRPQRRRVLLLGGLLLVGLSLSLLNPRIMQSFIDRAVQGDPLQTLWGLGAIFLAVAIATQILSVLEAYVAQNIAMIVTNRLRSDLTRHCLSLDMSFHNARTPGEMIERVDGDVSKLSNFMSSFLVQLTLNSLLVVGILILLFALDWRVGLPVAISVIVAVISARLLNSPLARLSAQEQQRNAELFGFFEERLSGTEDIRANGATGYVLRRHIERARARFWAALKAALTGAVAWRSMHTAIDLGNISALIIGAWLCLDGALSLGTVYVIFAYTQMLKDPIENITRELGDLQQATASIGRVQELLNMRSSLSIPASNEVQSLPAGPLSVSLNNISFAYPDDDRVLHQLSVALPAGHTLGVLGRSGSGKTTLGRLLLRLYDPEQGEVCLGGVNVRHITNTDLRTRVSVVTQDIHLFSASVRDNLTMFDKTVPNVRIQAALEAVGLDDWLLRLPKGLDTMLAAGGSALSAGEAQLLAFARAFLRDPGLVILDEASSRLDPATERKLDQAVSRLLAGRTGIIIAHRLSTLQRVQQILILEEGRVRENGPREALARDPQSRFSQLLSVGIEEVLV